MSDRPELIETSRAVSFWANDAFMDALKELAWQDRTSQGRLLRDALDGSPLMDRLTQINPDAAKRGLSDDQMVVSDEGLIHAAS